MTFGAPSGHALLGSVFLTCLIWGLSFVDRVWSSPGGWVVSALLGIAKP